MVEEEKPTRGQQIVESLLAKPSMKPDFGSFQRPEILKRAQAFLPAFITSTDKILSNPELRQASQMEIKINRSEDFNPATQEAEFQKLHQQSSQSANQGGPTIVNMDIGVGVFDVQDNGSSAAATSATHQQRDQSASASLEGDQLPPGMGFHQTSTEPILRMTNAPKNKRQQQKCPNNHPLEAQAQDSDDSDSDEDSSSSGDEDRFMQFDSSDDDNNDIDTGMQEEEMTDAQSLTTKSSANNTRKAPKRYKRPLIQEISSTDFVKDASSASSQMMVEESKDEELEQVQVGQKRRFRDR